MSFSDKMKEFAGQGVEVSKKFAAVAGEKAQDWGEKGLQAPKDFFSKASAKAQDLGERGVLKIEIKQLEGQAQKLFARLGVEVFQYFTEAGGDSLSMDTGDIRAIVDDIIMVKNAIDSREDNLEARKTADKA